MHYVLALREIFIPVTSSFNYELSIFYALMHVKIMLVIDYSAKFHLNVEK